MTGRLTHRAPKITTVIGPGTRMIGDLVFSGGLHLDGEIDGSVRAEAGERTLLAVGAGGVIRGDVRVDDIVLNGTVEGDIHAVGTVELVPGARVHGAVYYRVLEMAMGAEVNGKLVPMENKAASDASAPNA